MLKYGLAAAFGALAAKLVLMPRTSGPRHVRDAGPTEMRDPPKHWDALDEIGDESFPASDPPGTY